MIKKEKKWPTCKGDSSFSYSDQELHFRRDVDVIQQMKPLTWSGCFVPEGCDIYSYSEIEQGAGLCGNERIDSIISNRHPWIGIYEAFFNNTNFEYNDIQIVSNDALVSMLLNGTEVATRSVVGDYDGLLEVITLTDAGHRVSEVVGYLNRIIATYGHNIIVNDAISNPRYGRSDVEKQIHYSEKNIPWRIKDDFSNNKDIKMVDWTGFAKIEVRLSNETGDSEGNSLKTTLYIGNAIRPIGTMSSYNLYPIEHFNNYYKK